MHTSSPGSSRANPNTSNPQTILATVAGANTCTCSFSIRSIRLRPHFDQIRKYAPRGHLCAGTRAFTHPRPFLIPFGGKRDDAIAAQSGEAATTAIHHLQRDVYRA